MARKLGGPLLCAGDLLADLSHEDEDSDYNHEKRPAASFSQSPHILHQIFEKNYEDLNVALTNSGDSWIGLTQKICTALKAADRLVETSHVELEQLSEKVHTLENILKRGDAACQNFRLMKEKQNSLRN